MIEPVFYNSHETWILRIPSDFENISKKLRKRSNKTCFCHANLRLESFDQTIFNSLPTQSFANILSKNTFHPTKIYFPPLFFSKKLANCGTGFIKNFERAEGGRRVLLKNFREDKTLRRFKKPGMHRARAKNSRGDFHFWLDYLRRLVKSRIIFQVKRREPSHSAGFNIKSPNGELPPEN